MGVCTSVPAKGRLQEGQARNKRLLIPDKVSLLILGVGGGDRRVLGPGKQQNCPLASWACCPALLPES